MFGFIGRSSHASKVSFTDFVAEKFELKPKYINAQHSPNSDAKSGIYKQNGKFKGYKLYKNTCKVEKAPSTVYVETIRPASEFVGKIFFKHITDDELQLLLFAWGIDNSFNIKVGGFKNDGLGQVKSECLEVKLNGEMIENPKELAQKYLVGYGKYFNNSVSKLKDILKPSKNSR